MVYWGQAEMGIGAEIGTGLGQELQQELKLEWGRGSGAGRGTRSLAGLQRGGVEVLRA